MGQKVRVINVEQYNMRLPNIWGEGSLFAYSGIDGKTDWYHPFIGTFMSDRLGVIFHLRGRRQLWCGQFLKEMDISNNIIVSDLIDVTIEDSPIWFVFINKDIVLGKTDLRYPPKTTIENQADVEFKPNTIIQSYKGEHTTLLWEEHGNVIKFAYAFDASSRDKAISKAQRALSTDIEEEHKKKLAFYQRLVRPKFLEDRYERAYYKAFSVLKVNVESPQGNIDYTWTTPDRIPHRNMWLWDSVFHALAYKYISLQLAEESLEAVLSKQRDDGFIPHMMTPEAESSLHTQPPLLAWGVWNIYKDSRNLDFLTYAYPRLKSYIFWDIENRDTNGTGLLTWLKQEDNQVCRGGESGMDNSPRFDFEGQDEAIDFNSFIVNEMECLEEMAKILGINEDAKMWEAKRIDLKKLINRNLWDIKESFYYDRNENGQFVRIKTVASFTPLFAGVADKLQAENMVKHLTDKEEFWRPFLVPSTAANEPSYSDDMWRGPVWLNYNYLIIEGLKRYGYGELAKQIAERTLQEVAYWHSQTGNIFEYYDSEARTMPGLLHRKGGIGGVVKDYNWSAAVYVSILLSDSNSSKGEVFETSGKGKSEQLTEKGRQL